MKALLAHRSLYQIKTRVWLTELGRAPVWPARLDNILMPTLAASRPAPGASTCSRCSCFFVRRMDSAPNAPRKEDA